MSSREIRLRFTASTKAGTEWFGAIDQAFFEFFRAKRNQNKLYMKRQKRMAEGKSVGEYPAEIGNGEENAFVASNGITIWWEVE